MRYSLLFPSSPRKRGGGFTFEVQQLAEEDLSWGLEVQALSGGIVIGSDELVEVLCRDGGEVGFARQGPAHSADGVFDAAFLPGCVRIAEEGFEGEAVELA